MITIRFEAANQVRLALEGPNPKQAADAQACLDRWIAEEDAGLICFDDSAREVLADFMPPP